MAEELGKIEKPRAEDFQKGRKLFFIPLIYRSEEPPEEYLDKFNRYWEQVENQINELESKLGKVSVIYHEMIAVAGAEGIESIKELNEKSHKIVQINFHLRRRRGFSRIKNFYKSWQTLSNLHFRNTCEVESSQNHLC